MRAKHHEMLMGPQPQLHATTNLCVTSIWAFPPQPRSVWCRKCGLSEEKPRPATTSPDHRRAQKSYAHEISPISPTSALSQLVGRRCNWHRPSALKRWTARGGGRMGTATPALGMAPRVVVPGALVEASAGKRRGGPWSIPGPGSTGQGLASSDEIKQRRRDDAGGDDAPSRALRSDSPPPLREVGSGGVDGALLGIGERLPEAAANGCGWEARTGLETGRPVDPM